MKRNTANCKKLNWTAEQQKLLVMAQGGDKIAQGREQLKATLKDNPELFEQIEAKVMALLQQPEQEAAPDFNDEAEGALLD